MQDRGPPVITQICRNGLKVCIFPQILHLCCEPNSERVDLCQRASWPTGHCIRFGGLDCTMQRLLLCCKVSPIAPGACMCVQQPDVGHVCQLTSQSCPHVQERREGLPKQARSYPACHYCLRELQNLPASGRQVSHAPVLRSYIKASSDGEPSRYLLALRTIVI